MLLDGLAGIRQWRNPPAATRFSIVLHGIFAATVVALMTYEFNRSPSASFIEWFRGNDWLFIALLALARLVAAAYLIASLNGRPHPEE